MRIAVISTRRGSGTVAIVALLAAMVLWGVVVSALGQSEMPVPADTTLGSSPGAAAGPVANAWVQVTEDLGRPMYQHFIALFYLGLQVLATLATVVFIFIVLLKREEE